MPSRKPSTRRSARSAGKSQRLKASSKPRLGWWLVASLLLLVPLITWLTTWLEPPWRAGPSAPTIASPRADTSAPNESGPAFESIQSRGGERTTQSRGGERTTQSRGGERTTLPPKAANLQAANPKTVPPKPPPQTVTSSQSAGPSSDPAELALHDASAAADEPQLGSRVIAARESDFERRLDPESDGWPSEAIAEMAQTQLALIGDYLRGQGTELPLTESTFRCTPLRPSSLQLVFDEPPWKVWQAADLSLSGIDADPIHPDTPREGAGEGLAGSAVPADGHRLNDHVRSATLGETLRWVVKTIGVQRAEDHIVTRHLIESLSRQEEGLREQHATWNCTWRMRGSQDLVLQILRVESYQESHHIGTRPLFMDKTSVMLSNSDSYRRQLTPGLNHWLNEIETVHGMYAFAEYGLALGDANGDGLEDLYVCQPGGLPNRLFLRAADGTLRDAPDDNGTDWLDQTSSALFLDLDNDGDQDLVLAIEDRRVLCLRNQGAGSFELAATLRLQDRHVQMLCAADYDADGDVDLYVTLGHGDERARQDEARPGFVYHNANDGGANRLFRNDIQANEWQFEDVTREVGLDVHNRRHSLAAGWDDFDHDGDVDLYVANDYGQNCLYRNDDGHFHDIAVEAGVVDFGSGMSVSWGDVDRDGVDDLYVGNMFSTAGHRITTQASFRPRADEDERAVVARFAKGNTLFRNLGHGAFHDITSDAGVAFGRWAWSSLLADINNDGWQDIVVANGYITNDLPDDL